MWYTCWPWPPWRAGSCTGTPHPARLAQIYRLEAAVASPGEAAPGHVELVLGHKAGRAEPSIPRHTPQGPHHLVLPLPVQAVGPVAVVDPWNRQKLALAGGQIEDRARCWTIRRPAMLAAVTGASSRGWRRLLGEVGVFLGGREVR